MDNPRELGADRLVNAVAAYDRVGGACAVVDFGTAITFDAISAEGEYLGGVIGPGVEISMEALTERAAKLPKVDLVAPESVIGKTTQASIQSGIVFGFAGAIDAIARRIANELGDEAEFIATGGLASSIAPYCEMIDDVDDLLTLTGLRLIWEMNTGDPRPAPLTSPFSDRAGRASEPDPAGAAGRYRQLVRAPAGAPPRRRARGLGDGLELRDQPRQRAHPARDAADRSR